MPTFQDIELTSLRWLLGICAGVLIAFLISVLELLLARRGSMRPFAWLLSKARDFLRALPVIALVPIVQSLGVRERWKIALIAWAVMFPIWVSIRQSLVNEMVDTSLALAAAGVSRREMLLCYQVPKMLSGLLRGVEISIGIGWISVVAAEWVGTFTPGFWAGGLGFRIQVAHDANNWVGMFACLGLFGALGVSTAILWSWLMKTLLRRFEQPFGGI